MSYLYSYSAQAPSETGYSVNSGALLYSRQIETIEDYEQVKEVIAKNANAPVDEIVITSLTLLNPNQA